MPRRTVLVEKRHNPNTTPTVLPPRKLLHKQTWVNRILSGSNKRHGRVDAIPPTSEPNFVVLLERVPSSAPAAPSPAIDLPSSNRHTSHIFTVSTNAMIMYSAPLGTHNSFATLNLVNEDIQEDLLARQILDSGTIQHSATTRCASPTMRSPSNSCTPSNKDTSPADYLPVEKCNEIDGVTTTESEQESFDNYPNDTPPTEDPTVKIAKKMGSPKKGTPSQTPSSRHELQHAEPHLDH